MAILVFFTSVFLSTLIQYIGAELYPQFNTISDTNKYVYNINPVTSAQFHNLYKFGTNIPLLQNAQNRAGYNFGQSYGLLPQNYPLYTEKKVTTIKKVPVRKQRQFHKSVPSFKPGQVGRGKWPIQGYGKGIYKGKGYFNTNSFDLVKTMNNFNKQVEQIHKNAFDVKFKQERGPRYENSVGQNKATFDYVPVNLDAKFNNHIPFNFNTNLKFNNMNSINSISDILNANWHQNSAPVNTKPVKYATFVPGIDTVDTSGKILSQSPPTFESFLGQGNGGDPTSFVKVNNGKVFYTYHIRHLPNKH